MHTEFAPAERVSDDEILRQSRLFPDVPVLQDFMDAVPSIVLVVNQQRQIVFANQRLFDLLGLAPPEHETVYGRRPGEVLMCSHAFENEGGCGTTRFCSTCGAVNAILSSQKMVEDVQECRIIQTPVGHALDFRAWATPVRLGDELFTTFSILDISHEKRRETLERLFFHDVLTTAGGLKGSAELVRGAGAQELDDLHETILGLSNELIEEIQAQRQLAAAESNDLVLQPVPVVSTALLAEVADQYARHEAAAGQCLRVDPDAWQGSVTADRTLLRRVVGNMAKNALEASRPGDVVVLGSERDGEGIAFWVHNPGFIPEEIQLQIFQRSFSTKGEGRGLGTYSIKLLTEQYLKGSVSFSTSRDDGTTFRVRLPEASAVAKESGGEDADTGDGQRAKLSILLADDNAVNRRLAAALLERSGHTVTLCENGREAVDLSAGQTYDLVLMDVQMPEMDGIEATQAIRAREIGSDAHTPILAMTALSGGEDLERCLKAGMDGSVSKPIRPEELVGYSVRPENVGSQQDGVAQEAPAAALDLESAISRVAGDRDLLVEIAGLFLDNCPKMLDEIRNAVAADDSRQLERSAHTLKGSVANFSADAAVEAALELEQMGREADLRDAQQSLRVLEERIEWVIVELKAFSEEGGG